MRPLWKDNIDLRRREQVEEKGERMEEEEERSYQVDVIMSCPSREDAHTTDRHTLQLLRWLTIPPVVTFPDTYGGKLAYLH